MHIQLLIATCLAAFVAIPSAARAANDFKIIEGFLTEPLILPDHEVAEIATDGGLTYYVDLRALPRTPVRLDAQTPVTVVGYQGERPELLLAQFLRLREVPPPPPYERSSVDLRVVEGKIASMTRGTLMLRTTTGMVAVHIGGVSARFIAGEIVRVLGVLNVDNAYAANVVILQSPFRPAPAVATREADARKRDE